MKVGFISNFHSFIPIVAQMKIIKKLITIKIDSTLLYDTIIPLSFQALFMLPFDNMIRPLSNWLSVWLKYLQQVITYFLFLLYSYIYY